MFKQPVEPIQIEWTSKPHRNKLEALSEDLVQPQPMSNQQLREYNVKPDFNEAEYFEQLEKDEEIDLRDFFDSFGDGNTYQNSIDHIALQLNRGDAILSISSLKILEFVGIADHDNCTNVVCAENDCLTVIATSWIGGDATSNLLIDFRTDTPKINRIESYSEACIDAITTLADGTIAVRDWNEDIGFINPDNFFVEDFKDPEILEIAERALQDCEKTWIHNGLYYD